jgi:abequosyltransferase
LIDTLRGILNQAVEIGAEKELEICISNNGSTDGTKAEVEKLVADFPNVRFVINNFETNIGGMPNFVKVLSMPSGRYVMLKGDDDYFRPGGLKYLLDEIKSNPDVGLFINDVDMVDKNRKFLDHLSYLRDTDELRVNFCNELEARNYFTLCKVVHALGCFTSGVVVKGEAFKAELDKVFLEGIYMHMFFFWKYLLSGKILKYSSKPYVQAVINTDSCVGYGIQRDAMDVRDIAFIADYFFKDSSLNTDFKNVVNRNYMFWPFVPIDQRRDFKEKLYPALKVSGHPMIGYIKKQSSPLILLGMFMMSLMPTSWTNRLTSVYRKMKK